MLEKPLDGAIPVQAHPADAEVTGPVQPGGLQHADDLLRRVNGLRRARHAGEALRLLEDALVGLPEPTADLALTHGRLLLALHRPEDAAAVLGRAYELHGDSVDVTAWLIASLSRGRHYDKAELLAAEGCRKFPASGLVRVASGRLMVDQHRFEEALPYLRKAYDLEPNDPRTLTWLMHGLRHVRSFDEIDAVIAMTGLSVAMVRIEYVRGLLDRYQFERVLAELDLVTEEHAEVHALQLRLEALRGLHRLDEAQQIAIEAIARTPDDPRPRIELGYVLHRCHRFEDALAAFKHTLAIDPYDAGALEWHTTELRHLHRLDEAEQSAHDAISRRPDVPELHLELGYVHEDRHDYEQALTAFEHALAIDPRHEWALIQRTRALLRLRRLDKAEESALQAIEKRPDSPQLHLVLGYVQGDKHDYEQSLTATEHALAIDPRHELALNHRTGALRRLRRLDKAEESALQAIKKRPDSPQLHLQLGYVHGDKHDYEQALTAFEAALAIDPHDAGALEWRTTELRHLHRLDEAEQSAHDAISRRPDVPELHLELGYVHEDRHDYEQALTAFEHALAIDPRHEWALIQRTRALLRLRRLDKAEESALQAIEKRPDSPQLHLELGYVHDARHDYEQSLAAFEAALAIDPRHEWALIQRTGALRRLRRLDKAEESALQAIKKRPDSPQLHLQLGYVHGDKHDYEQALTAFEAALAIDPHDAGALEWRTTELRHLHRLDEAEQSAHDAISRRPDVPELHLELGYVHEDRHDYEQALTAFEHALAIDPRHEWALIQRTRALLQLRRLDKAEESALQAIKKRPDSPQLHLQLAYVHDARHDYEQALTATEHALAIDPRHEWALIQRTRALLRLRRLDKAEESALQAIEKRPDSPQLHLELGYVHGDKHDYEQSLTATEHALAIDPRHEWALNHRTGALRRLRRLDKAEESALQAIKKRPDSPQLHLQLGYVHGDKHDYEQALTAFEAALAIDPHDAGALEWRTTELRHLHRLDEAEQSAHDAISRRPNVPELHLELGYVHEDRHNYEQALTAFEHALAIDPRHEWALIQRTRALLQLRRLDKAEESALQAIKKRPDSPALRLELVEIAEDRGDYQAALAATQKALALDPKEDSALAAQIRVMRRSRNFKGALTAAQEATALRPNSVDVLVELGQVHADQHDDNKALSIFDRALAIEPGHVQLVERQVAVLQRLQRHLEAEQCARAAVALRPMAESLHISLGRVYEDRLQMREALACYQDAARLNSRDPRVLASQSAALRALRSYAEAERLIAPSEREQPYLRALTVELAWIQHDSGRLSEARATFARLERSALSDEERAAAIAGLGWVDFACDDYVSAEERFGRAADLMPYNREYRLARAWALVRQDGSVQWEQAEQICLEVLDEQQDAAVLVCLGVIDYRLGRLPAAEYHLLKALEIDPYRGSHTDLAALYIQLGRYEEAEAHLRVAIAQDPYNLSAQVELGHVRLLTDQPQEAARQFRGVLRVDPSMQVAALGLAESLTALGQSREAEDVLREGLRTATVPWRLHLALARLLFHQADATQSDDIFAEAYAEAIEAIKEAPASEPDPHYVAAVCKVRLGGSTTAGTLSDAHSRRHALRHLRRCLSIDRGHVDAQRVVQLLERENRTARTAALGTATVATVALGLLTVMWTAFFLSDRVTVIMITTITPILVGLVAVAVLLPSLIRLKLPGFEADLQAGLGQITSGPTGEVVIRPGNLAISAGPVGFAPNRRRSEERQRS